jgi:uncharacterized protein
MKSPVPIADCHGHVGVHPDFPACKVSPGEMLEVMDLLNIEILAITSTLACYNDVPRGNAEIAAVLKQHPGRFLGYITVNPNPPGQALEQLQRYSFFHNPPLIKLHPDLGKYPVTGANLRPVWDYAHQTRAIVLVHTWDSDPNCGPLLLERIAREYPRARILLGHAGVTSEGYDKALEVARAAENVFLDISGSQSYRLILEHCIAQIGAERILFGSDMPYLEASVPLGRVMTARISDRDRELIFRENLLRLLK